MAKPKCLVPSIKCQLPQGSKTNRFGFTLPHAADTGYIKPKCYHQPCPKGKQAEVSRAGNPVLKKGRGVFCFVPRALTRLRLGLQLASLGLCSRARALPASPAAPLWGKTSAAWSEGEAGPLALKICTFMHSYCFLPGGGHLLKSGPSCQGLEVGRAGQGARKGRMRRDHRLPPMHQLPCGDQLMEEPPV